ncbi:helix-turn-helix domain-containing protein [Actinomadura sp. 7K507]|uniref:helix-turn-helix domain-containing protein n=1 Tax=Actinomadura sp. 7K507 TaxID=2530365 RepID=UPI001043BFFD|nr:helix-turn-helix domain-containing protein [Actinomadura sp. 7K507]TDC95698.1 ArsR family transcriptional regulator [Actinomadura sp. 7K507]
MASTDSSAADLLLHPVRWRIVQVLQGRELTTAQLRGLLTDVPPATLYRQIATLVQAELVHVVHERKVRGAVERTYALRNEDEFIGEEAAGALDREQHRHLFRMFTEHLRVDFERYLERANADPAADAVTYRQAALNLTGDELSALAGELSRVLAPYLDLEAAPDRTRVILTTILMPDD